MSAAGGQALPGELAASVRVRIRYFALQRQQLGRSSEELQVVPGSLIGDVWRELVERYPVLAAAGESMRFARNGRYAGPSDALDDGDELALIPPIAGGSDVAAGGPDPSAAAGDSRFVLTPHPITSADLEELRRSVATPADGAIVLFVGQTRETPGTPAPGQEADALRYAGQAVIELEYEAFESMALAILREIGDEVEQQFGVTRLAIVHRTGRVGVSELSVAIAAAAAHRGAAFDACRYAIDELKARAPIWKQERFADGGVWLGRPARPGPADRQVPLEPLS